MSYDVYSLVTEIICITSHDYYKTSSVRSKNFLIRLQNYCKKGNKTATVRPYDYSQFTWLVQFGNNSTVNGSQDENHVTRQL
jgi:hypothetical protein